MTKSPAMREVISFVQIRDSDIGLRRTEARALPETKDSRPNPVVITYSYPRHALGRIGPSHCVAQKAEDIVSMSNADRPKTEGWAYSQGIDDLEPGADGVFRLYQVYAATDPAYTGKVTVPTLWDRERRTIVNNESSEIIRMFNSAFKTWTDVGYDFYPEDLRAEIDRINDLVYSQFNNGVYRAGFARSQEAYEEAARKVFHCLDTLEGLLGERRYLAGDRLTEADWRVFPTLLRFDLVYYSHFKCNLRRIQDYPNLANYLRELYQWPGIKDALDLQKIKAGYYSQGT
jgi:putative glutathione S-transferase